MKSEFKDVGILAVSVTVPSNIDIVENLTGPWVQKDIQRATKITGIHSLRRAPIGVATSDLCLISAKRLFDECNYSQEEICAIVFVSQTPDYTCPATSCVLQDKLGFSKDVLTYDINDGCAGWLYGLQLSAMLSKAHDKNVLLLNGDVQWKVVSDEDKSVRTILGDAGAAAIVGQSKGNIMCFNFVTDGSKYDRIIVPCGGTRNPVTKDSFTITEREHGNFRSDMHVFMDSSSVLDFAINDVVEMVKQEIDYCKIKYNINYYFFHQANQAVLKLLRSSLGIPKEKVPIFVDGYGNTSSASLPLALCGIAKSELITVNNYGHVIFVAFGVGFKIGTLLTDMSKTMFDNINEFKYLS